MDTIKWRSILRAFMCRSIAFAAILVLATFVLSGSVGAQPKLKDVLGESPEKEKAAEEPKAGTPKPKYVRVPIPEDEYDRGTPRTAFQGFMKATGEGNYVSAAEYLNFSSLGRGLTLREGPQLAHQLRIVLDRALWVDFDLLSNDPRGEADDGLPSHLERLGRIETPERAFNILLEFVPREDGVYVWKFSSTTVAQIPRLYAHFGYGALAEALSAVFPEAQFLGLQIWQWIGFLVLVALAYLAALVVAWTVAFFLRRGETELRQLVVRVVTGPVRLLLMVLIFRACVDLIHPTVAYRAVLRGKTVLIIAIVWTTMPLLDILADRLAQRLKARGQKAAIVLLRPVGNAVKICILLIATLMWLDNIGIKVTTFLASLGVGGLALALAARSSIENMLGAITLYVSRPVRVGDFCRFGKTVGTVEEIGLRSTRVRTLDRTVVSVPNAEFVRLHLENMAMRDKIRYHPRIRLRYETTPDQIRFILVEVRKLLYAHPKVLRKPARIRFTEFGEYSLDLDIFAYIEAPNYNKFLEVAEDLNLRIMDIIATSGSSLAVPSQTTYFERGKGLNEELAREAEAQVKEWKENDELYLPNFPKEKIEELRGSLDYPPTGSPGASDREGE
jgi:MscS family membrane protein